MLTDMSNQPQQQPPAEPTPEQKKQIDWITQASNAVKNSKGVYYRDINEAYEHAVAPFDQIITKLLQENTALKTTLDTMMGKNSKIPVNGGNRKQRRAIERTIKKKEKKLGSAKTAAP